MQPILEVRDLFKSYKDIKAVNGVSFSVRTGEVAGLLGPNGAGKTSTINMILGILKPSAGSVSICGRDVEREHSLALKETNFAAIYAELPGNMTVFQNLYIFALIYGVSDARGRVREVIDDFDLGALRDTRCGLLSSGEQTRLHLAKAFINKPKLLLLDEPTASLDPSASRIIRERVRAYAASGQAAVLWTTHNMHEAEEVCDRVCFLSRGKILLEGNPRTLPRLHKKSDLEDLFITVAMQPLSLKTE